MESPVLPWDILLDIFELAARQSRKTASTLITLHSLVHRLVTRILYHTVNLDTADALLYFAELALNAESSSQSGTQTVSPRLVAKDAHFFATHVKYLTIKNVSVPYHYIEHVFWVCSGVETLEKIGLYFPPDIEASLETRDTMHPQSLITSDPYTFQLGQMPLYSQLTHIWIENTVIMSSTLAHVPPTTTHLAVPVRIDHDYKTRNVLWLTDPLERKTLQRLFFNIEMGPRSLGRRSTLTSHDLPTPIQVWEHCFSGTVDERIRIRPFKNVGEEVQHCRSRRIDIFEWAEQDGVAKPPPRPKPEPEQYVDD